MTLKRVLRTGAFAIVASMVITAVYLLSPQALHRAMTAIASAVWGS
jgi:hypothetical protein